MHRIRRPPPRPRRGLLLSALALLGWGGAATHGWAPAPAEGLLPAASVVAVDGGVGESGSAPLAGAAGGIHLGVLAEARSRTLLRSGGGSSPGGPATPATPGTPGAPGRGLRAPLARADLPPSGTSASARAALAADALARAGRLSAPATAPPASPS